MILLPKLRIVKLVIAQHTITPVMGNAVWLLKKLTMAVASEPIPICIAPNKAEALPAVAVKGASERADEFGKVNPWQHRKMKMRNTVLYNSIRPVIAPIKSREPVMLWQNKATLIICSLLYFLKSRLFI